MKSILCLAALTLPLLASAHNKIQTPEDIEIQRSLQAAAYHVGFALLLIHPLSLSSLFFVVCTSNVRHRVLPPCSPTNIVIRQEFTAARKRSWAQKVLGGRPSLAGYEDLFDSGTYRDLAATEHGSGGQKLLSCVEEIPTEIRNNSCVLGTPIVFYLIHSHN